MLLREYLSYGDLLSHMSWLLSLRHLEKYEPRKLCRFSHAVYRILKTTLRLLLQKFPEHAVDFVFFSDEKSAYCSVASQLAGRCVYAPSNAKLRDIAPERLLRCRPTFSSSLMVSVAVSELRCTELFFVKPRAKVDSRFSDDECRRHNKPKQCRFRDTVYSMTKRQFSGFLFPQIVQRH